MYKRQALVFTDTPLVSGTAITHQAGSPDVEISQSGIYLAAFNGTVSVAAGTTIPSSVIAQLYLNGAPVPGASAQHTFASSSEVATLSFHVPFRVDAPPATLRVVINADGFTFEDRALTVIRLGDAT